MATLDVTCPNCDKAMRVPAEAAGKRIRCKACSHVFTVGAGGGGGDGGTAKAAKPLPDEFKKAAGKPVKAKPKPILIEDDEPKPAAAPIGFADEDDGPKDYKVQKDDLDIPRCPRCAKELESEDDRICLNCGYDMEIRRQHQTVKTFKRTGGDVFLWWLPAVIWAIVLLSLLGFWVVIILKLEGWMLENEVLVRDDVNPITGKKEFIVGPGACIVSCFVEWLALAGFGVPVIVRRLRQPLPSEIEKKK
jgi:ssDNA-binding Zn-finger/Zn-ribbon topoisomerase 1